MYDSKFLPSIPSWMNAVPPLPAAAFPTQMPSVNGMTGNLFAGTLQPAHPNFNGNPRNMRSTNCAQTGLQNGWKYQNQQSNQRSNSQLSRPNGSIATTLLSDHNRYRYNEPHRILQNEEYEQRKQVRLQMLAQPLDKDSAKYKFQYSSDLPTPTKLRDFHWICYHYKSGEDYSCRFGSQCRWRHYDFQNRRDIQTAWDIEASMANAPEPGVKQIKEAQELRKLIGRQFPYVFEEGIGDHGKVGKECMEMEERNDEDDSTQDSDCDHTQDSDAHDAESANDEDKQKPLVEVDKVDNEDGMIRADACSTLLAMMTPFNNPRHSEVNYYLIGKFVAQQLQQLVAAKK